MFVFVEFFIVYLCLSKGAFSGAGLISAIFIIICTFGVAAFFIDDFIIRLHPGNRMLLKVLSDVKNMDFSKFTIPEDNENVFSSQYPVLRTDDNMLKVQGIIELSQIAKFEVPRYRGSRQFRLGVHFYCKKIPMFTCWLYREVNECRALFLRWHPPFFSDGDTIVAVCSPGMKVNKYFRYIPQEGHQVSMLKNITDGSLYLPAIGFYMPALIQISVQRRSLMNII